MTEKKTKNGVFFKNTPKFILWQITIWDTFAKASPFLFLIVASFLYCIGFRDSELFWDTLAIMILIIFIVWWFWILYTIASIAYVLDKSSENLKNVIDEIIEIRKEVIDLTKKP